MRYGYLGLLATLLSSALASNVVELDSQSFRDVIGKGKPALVEFCEFRCSKPKSCGNLTAVL